MPTKSPSINQSAMPANSGRPVKLRQSCDACSQAKVKCSKEPSNCSRCVTNDLRCVYGESRRFGRVSNKKRTASRDSVSTERISASTETVQHQRQEFGPSFHHTELWPPEFPLPFDDVPSNTFPHGECHLVCESDKDSSMSGDKPNTGSGQPDSRQSNNAWAMPIDFDHLPSSLIPTQRLSTSGYGRGTASVDSETAPAFQGLSNLAKEPAGQKPIEVDPKPLSNQPNRLGSHNDYWNYSHPTTTRPAEMQVQDKISTARQPHNPSDWPHPVRCDRCKSSATKSPQPSADDIFRTNRIALQQVSRMLACECSKDAHLAMLFASILTRVLAGYRTIIESETNTPSHNQVAQETSHNSPVTRLSDPPGIPTSPHRWSNPVRPSISNMSVHYGSFSLDQGDVDLLRQTLAVNGLRRAEQVVLQMESLHGHGQTNRLDSNSVSEQGDDKPEDVAHVTELYKLLSGWLKSDIQKTLDKVNSVHNVQR